MPVHNETQQSRTARKHSLVLSAIVANSLTLSGCASLHDLETLRAEVEQAHSLAVRAAADASRARREMEALETAAYPSTICSMETEPAPVDPGSGYKWGSIPASPAH